jgi:hypothetical protein
MTYRGDRVSDRPREQPGTLAIVLQEVPCKALRSLWTDARQATQGIHQGFQKHRRTVEIHEQSL